MLIPKMSILERLANLDLYLKKDTTKKVVKPSVGRHIAILSRTQSSYLWCQNVKLKVRAVFTTGIVSEIIK